MRINKFLARATGLSRRAADQAIEAGRVTVNGKPTGQGIDIDASDTVKIDNRPVSLPAATTTVMLNKPVGYVCSRDGQGSPTVYDLLPPGLRVLKTVGRLDKDSSGLLLLTNDGDLADRLTHPRYDKEKVYEIELDKPLAGEDRKRVEQGVKLEDGISRLQIKNLKGKSFTVIMSEGRNRQIRRTFARFEYKVIKLHRVKFGGLSLGTLPSGHFLALKDL